MVEKIVNAKRNIIDLSCYQQARAVGGNVKAIPARICRHCGAPLLDGENEDECSSALNTGMSANTLRLREKPRRFYAE
jgi:hypothetical protein